eukprot:2139177-Lingulodinium_polyedra.AAC.1
MVDVVGQGSLAWRGAQGAPAVESRGFLARAFRLRWPPRGTAVAASRGWCATGFATTRAVGLARRS